MKKIEIMLYSGNGIIEKNIIAKKGLDLLDPIFKFTPLIIKHTKDMMTKD